MIKFPRVEFAKVLNNAVRFTTGKVMPILRYVYIYPSEGKLHVMASNYEMWFEEALPLEGDIEEFLVHGKTLEDIVSSLEGEEIYLNVIDENKVGISAGNTYYELAILKEEYPQPPKGKFTQRYHFTGKELKAGYEKVAFAAAKEEVRPEFTGILLDAKDGYLNFVASDASRLALYRYVYEGEGFRFLVPRRVFSEVVRMVEDDDDVVISPDELIEVVCSGGDGFKFRLVSRGIVRRFPDYDRVINVQGKVEVKVGRKEFINSLSRAKIVASEDMLRVKLDVQRDRVVISAQAFSVGKFQEELPAVVEGEGEVYYFNVQYLLDGLRVIEGGNVRMVLGRGVQAAKIEDEDRSDWLYVVMPMYPPDSR